MGHVNSIEVVPSETTTIQYSHQRQHSINIAREKQIVKIIQFWI